MGDLQLLCLGIPEIRRWFYGVAVLAGPDHFPERQPFHGQCPRGFAAGARREFAKSSVDKFAGVSWTPGLGKAPMLADSVANFQCRAANRYYGGDHVIILGPWRLMPTTARAAVVCERRLRPVHLGRRQKVVVTGEHRSALKPMYLSRSPARFVALEGDVTG